MILGINVEDGLPHGMGAVAGSPSVRIDLCKISLCRNLDHIYIRFQFTCRIIRVYTCFGSSF